MSPNERVAVQSALHRSAAAEASQLRRWTLALLLAVAGVIHLLPLPGVFGAQALQRLYGITLDDPNLLLLLQHRAVLFGLLGALILGAIRVAAWRPLALGAGLISTTSFLVLALVGAEYSPVLQRVVVADVVALVCLLVATGLWALTYRAQGRALASE